MMAYLWGKIEKRQNTQGTKKKIGGGICTDMGYLTWQPVEVVHMTKSGSGAHDKQCWTNNKMIKWRICITGLGTSL